MSRDYCNRQISSVVFRQLYRSWLWGFLGERGKWNRAYSQGLKKGFSVGQCGRYIGIFLLYVLTGGCVRLHRRLNGAWQKRNTMEPDSGRTWYDIFRKTDLCKQVQNDVKPVFCGFFTGFGFNNSLKGANTNWELIKTWIVIYIFLVGRKDMELSVNVAEEWTDSLQVLQ